MLKATVAGAVLSLLVVVTACGELASQSIETCDDLLPHIIELSEEKESPFSPRILKVSNIAQVSKSDSELVCRGLARWSRGGESGIRFHWERDSDGDSFVGYRRE